MDKISVGLLTVFNHEIHEWELYKGRIEQWFLANEINDDVDKSGAKRRAILLSSLAEATFKLIRDLALPNEVGSLSYLQVVSLLDGHFKAKKCGFAERYKFHSAVQSDSESLSEWAARVRGLAMDCSFPAGTLNEMLRDRFVLGMVPGKVRERLFEKSLEGFTMEKALQVAESVHCAREGARQAATSKAQAHDLALSPFVEVNKVSTQPKSSQGRQTGGASVKRESVSSAVSANNNKIKCNVCGFFGHDGQFCKFRFHTCKRCLVKGHLQRACARRGRENQHFLQYCSDDGADGDDGKRLIFNLRSYGGEPMRETIVVDTVSLCFEIDTGSAVTAFSDSIYNEYFSKHKLRDTNRVLQSYNGSTISTLGIIPLEFTYKDRTETIEVYVVKDGGPPILGRDFIYKFNLKICPVNICTAQVKDSLENLITKYPKLFSNSLGCCKDIEVSLNLKPDSKPIFFKARSVPFALRGKLESELSRLTSLGVIEPVKFSEYASPIVPVLKSNGDIRVCADYSATLNKQLIVEKYPLPRIEELFSKLHGGQKFTKLDLSNAYNQLKLKEESQLLTCINTHKGLFKYTRLVFGLSSAPAIFQRTLEMILSGIEGVLQFLDDILITGKTEQEHMNRLNEVFKRLEDAGLVLQKDKCHFFQESVSYLGYVIDKNGLHKSPDKVKAILKATVPTNVSELKSFLGLVNYYRGFINNASGILSPLHSLLKKNVAWKWDREHSEAFELIKKQLASDNTLAHFNPEAKIILTVDASPFALSGILSQIDESGVERPVAYISRSLNAAESRYSQIQKEVTAIIFGVRRFHQYLYGRAKPFILRTDHKPLLSIFQPGRGVPEITANRLQRYALFLSAYNYTIEYVSSANNSADFLSRATRSGDTEPRPQLGANSSRKKIKVDVSKDMSAYVHFMWDAQSSPVFFKDVQKYTKLDKNLSRVIGYVQNGWPRKVYASELKEYSQCRNELSVENGCLMRGPKLVVPTVLRGTVLNELHAGHLGVAKMKAAARLRFWWPKMSLSLEKIVSTCEVCAQLRPAPHRAPLTPWPYPPEPWYRVHLDFLGPINNKVFLVVVDAYSKWVEVYDVSSGYGSRVVIEKLSEIMSRFGLFNTICSDNGSSFKSVEFKNFCTYNGITHLTSPPYHPASNGQAESFVKIIKKALKGIVLSGTSKKDVNIKLNEFLFHYRNSIHSTTNRSPAELLFGRNLRCRLDLLKPHTSSSSSPDPELSKAVENNQCSQIKSYDGKRTVDFMVGEVVLVKMYSKQLSSWEKGIIKKKLGRSVYLVSLMDNDNLIKRHKNQIQKIEGKGEMPVCRKDQVLPPVILQAPAADTQPQTSDAASKTRQDGTESPEKTGSLKDPALGSPGSPHPAAEAEPAHAETPRAQRLRRRNLRAPDYRRYL